MKIRFPVLLLALFSIVAGSCNRHSWEDTKALYKEHDNHGAGEKHAEGEKHSEGEKKDAARP